MEPFDIDADLTNADWPKRTVDVDVDLATVDPKLPVATWDRARMRGVAPVTPSFRAKITAMSTGGIDPEASMDRPHKP